LQTLHRQGLAAVWQVARLVSLILAAVVAWHSGLAAVTTLWICSAIQAVACVGMLATMAIAINRLTTGHRESGSGREPVIHQTWN